jgi:hypothetical protein
VYTTTLCDIAVACLPYCSSRKLCVGDVAHQTTRLSCPGQEPRTARRARAATPHRHGAGRVHTPISRHRHRHRNGVISTALREHSWLAGARRKATGGRASLAAGRYLCLPRSTRVCPAAARPKLVRDVIVSCVYRAEKTGTMCATAL